MKKIIFALVVWLLLGAPAAFGASADVAQLVFITPPLTVAPNALSDALSVQAQNASGAAEAVSETNHLVLNSTSPTGQFLTSTGNALTATNVFISTGNSKRSFNYQDSTAGTYTITVSSTEHPGWVATQNITIGSGGGTSPPDSSATSTGTTSGSSSSSGSSLSTHSSPASLSVATPIGEPLKVSAGRARLSSVGASVIFKAEFSGTEPRFLWSFGDGGEAAGRQVAHTYLYPGEYEVVLTAMNGEEESIARTKVNVYEPKLSIATRPMPNGRLVTIDNQSSYEHNLGGWALVTANQRFVFPRDTIIARGKAITFSPRITGLTTPTAGLVLLRPDAEVFFGQLASVGGNERGQILDQVSLVLEKMLQTVEAWRLQPVT